MSGRLILCDLDGTLAHKDFGRGLNKPYDPAHIGDPIPLMLARVKQWLAEGDEVRIFTARMDPAHGNRETTIARAAIAAWTKQWVGQELQATAIKDYHVDEIWDDRAVGVELNTGRRLDGKSG